MLKNLIFKLFGHSMNMGHVVHIEDIMAFIGEEPVTVNIGEDQGVNAAKFLQNTLEKSPLGEYLASMGPYKLFYSVKTEWPTVDLMAWYQHPHLVITLTGLRFMEKPQFKPADLPDALLA